MKNKYDFIVIGGGAAGIMAAIQAARDGKEVLLLEKLPKIGAKLKATGGGRCNLTNRVPKGEFMEAFGRDGRFMRDALEAFDSSDLVKFFAGIGVDTNSLDGFRVFPTSRSSATVVEALQGELLRVGVDIKCNQKVEEILQKDGEIRGVKTANGSFFAKNIALCSGGAGYPSLGSEGDGYEMAKELGHTIKPLYPAMLPLKTKESWVAKCTADTLPKVQIKVDMKKHKKLKATGDLIFTKNGIRGPVVLDFAREITPLIERYGEVGVVLNVLKDMDEDKIYNYLREYSFKEAQISTLDIVSTLLPKSLANELILSVGTDPDKRYKDIKGEQRQKLIKTLHCIPLTIVGDDGFDKAMITRGGVSLKEIDPKTMQSRLVGGLYFCGEVVDIDGPCGGYNLQWSFSSGYLCAKSIKIS